jgi:hypothetical protein
MIPELIEFSEQIGDYVGMRREIKEPVIIIQTNEVSGKMSYLDHQTLKDEEDYTKFKLTAHDLQLPEKFNQFKLLINARINLKQNHKNPASKRSPPARQR